ncbi:MAG TPA: endo-1,4-beta-xylanase [Humisphaera sp.]|jgi:hypothetical protein|nr:endo-1,4-beta-xylanase [Humisphaera sp.]
MPIKFEIYRDGSRVNTFEPLAATAMGPESVPIPGDIYFRDGLLVVNRKDEMAAGIALLWDCGPYGAYVLETTRVMPSEKPYNLNVELARSRLMKIMQKQEDWSLFDFPKAEKLSARFSEAQGIFADALGKLDQPGEAAKLADQALVMAMDLSEELTSFHTDLLLSRRRSANSFVRHIFGCRVDPAVQNEKYKESLATNFDYCVLPMSWKEVQPQENTFNVDALDQWVEVLSKRRMPTIAGPLVRLDEAGVPDWMVIWENDFDMLREMAFDYVQKIVQRYRRAVAAWNVVGGLQTNSAFVMTFEQIIELTRLLVSQVKTLIPNARTLITIAHPFGEYHARGRASVPPMMYAEMVAQAGISFEAFALEIEMGVPAPGMFMRDLFQISTMLDRFASLGRPLFLTAVGSPGQPGPDLSDDGRGRLDPAGGGRWQRPWDPQLQADWMEAVYSMAMSKPYIESIAWANLADLRPTLPGGGLLDDVLHPKAAHQRLVQLREKIKPFQKR